MTRKAQKRQIITKRHNNLVERKKEQASTSRYYTERALVELGQGQTHEIYAKTVSIIKADIASENPLFTDTQLQRVISKQLFSKKTTIRRLADLILDGFATKDEYDIYRPTQKIKNDIGFFAESFAKWAFHAAGKTYGNFPISQGTYNKAIPAMVTRVGVSLVYAMMQALTPIEREGMDEAEKSKMVILWANKAVSSLVFRILLGVALLSFHNRISDYPLVFSKENHEMMLRKFKQLYPEYQAQFDEIRENPTKAWEELMMEKSPVKMEGGKTPADFVKISMKHECKRCGYQTEKRTITHCPICNQPLVKSDTT